MAYRQHTRKPLHIAVNDTALSTEARDLAQLLVDHSGKTDEEVFQIFTLMGNHYLRYEPLREEILRAGYKASRRY